MVILPPEEWNQTDRAYPGTLLHESFAAQVARDPGAPALRFRDELLTYAELDQHVDRLARYLVTLGVRPGSFVALCLERSIEMVVAVHAVLRAGGAYVPFDPEHPDERIAIMLEDLDQPIVLTQVSLRDRFTQESTRVVAVDDPLALPLPSAPAVAELPLASPDDPAYVIYTSGSTGVPKGAINSHRGIANRLHWQQEHFGLTPEDMLLQKTPYTFDASLWEFFWPLAVGAQLVIAEPGGHRDSAYLCQTIIEHEITLIHFVPSMLRLFLDDPRSGDCVSLRHVLCGGEALPRALHDRFHERLGADLHNLYGPAEAANDVTFWDCDRYTALPFVPIGRPMANTQIHLLDEAGHPVPVGDAGEIHIGGVHVGQGYLKRPDLTAERFLPDPFRPGGLLYRTGDLARHLPDGTIEFLGRSDYQVKVRGFRVELGEIEALLESIEGVRGAVVVTQERAAGDLDLVAYVAHPHGDRLSSEVLRTWLAEHLPDYMVPSTIVTLEQIPLNANGKVARAALPKPGRTRPVLDTPYMAPRTPLQRALAQRWRELLELDRIGVDDRFFELGGTSIDAARFVNQVQTELGETIFTTTLFAAPSVADYAALLERSYPTTAPRLLGKAGQAEPGQGVPLGALTTDGTGTDRAGEDTASGRRARTPSHAMLTRQRDRRRAARDV